MKPVAAPPICNNQNNASRRLNVPSEAKNTPGKDGGEMGNSEGTVVPRARKKQRLCADLPEQPEAPGLGTRLTGKGGDSIARDRGAPDSCPFLDSYGSPGVPAAHRVLPLIMMPNVPRESNPPAEKTVPTVQRAAPLFLPLYHRRFRFRSWAGAGASVSGI